MEDKIRISFIGPGKVGKVLAAAGAGAGLFLAGVGAREPGSTKAELVRKELADCGVDCAVVSSEEAAARGDFVILAVKDDAIAGLCAELASRNAFRSGAVVVHCSGALTSDILKSAKECCGCSVGSMHPLQSFGDFGKALANLGQTCFFCEGDAAAKERMKQFCEKIGSGYVEIEKEGKILYHAGAAVASNYLITLLDSAVRLLGCSGVGKEVAWQGLRNLVNTTIENFGSLGSERALTGPIERGDVETVRLHLEKMKEDASEFGELYSCLAQETVKIALRKGSIDDKKAMEFARMIKANSADDISSLGE